MYRHKVTITNRPGPNLASLKFEPHEEDYFEVGFVAKELRLPPKWLKEEAEAGRIPSLDVGKKDRLCTIEATREALAELAAQPDKPARRGVMVLCDVPVSKLGLSVAICAKLDAAGCGTIRELIMRQTEWGRVVALLRINGIGANTAEKILALLEKYLAANALPPMPELG